jgi:hypothetical protein
MNGPGTRQHDWFRIAEPPAGYTGRVRLRPPDPEYLKLLLPYGEAIQKLALSARKLVLEEAPEASEFIYELYTIADHFTFTGRPSDAFVFTTTHANWVNLGFNFGSLLPDPNDLLRGEGKLIRHVRIAQATDLDALGVRELLRAAIAQAERLESNAGKPRTVVRTVQSVRKRYAPQEDLGLRKLVDQVMKLLFIRHRRLVPAYATSESCDRGSLGGSHADRSTNLSPGSRKVDLTAFTTWPYITPISWMCPPTLAPVLRDEAGATPQARARRATPSTRRQFP